MDFKMVQKILEEKGQQHILTHFDKLSDVEKENLIKQIESVDIDVIDRLCEKDQERSIASIKPIDGLSVEDIEARKDEFTKAGIEAIKNCKVGAVLLAGGMGTRLGSDNPKGMYDVGITRELYIFECLINNMLDVHNMTGAYVPLYVMTSEKNDETTRKFFKEKNYFGYPADLVKFFIQEMAPAVDFDGKLLLEASDRLAVSPNGNGGWFTSIIKAGLLTDIEEKGIEWLNVFAVDNVCQRIADPTFVGATILSGCNCGAKSVYKADPYEKVGVLCLDNGEPSIVEYYELNDEMANARDAQGKFLYRYGVILNYLFSLDRLKEIAEKQIPIHIVKKKIPYIDANGNLVKPETENGYKFETLILDMIKLMGNCLPYEVVRSREFAPIKNKTGVDSVESARELLQLNGVKL